MVFINAKINNPRYPSQTKECLITESRDFGTSYEVSDKFIDQVLSSSIIQSVLDWVDSKKRQEELAKLRKASRENKNKKVPTHIKANSTRNNVLHICEGLSALGTFLQVRDKNKHGAFPLKGKPLNWRNAKSMVDVAKNAEISSIMSILGLEFGKKAENLNYTKIRYMTDADLDGAGSIVGLLNNFFSLWPELFETGVIEILKSPIVILYKKGMPTVYFYDISEFRKESSKYTDYSLKYVKGLGGLTEQEYDDMINKPMVSRVVLDDEGLDSLEMAFGADADRRKKWLLN